MAHLTGDTKDPRGYWEQWSSRVEYLARQHVQADAPSDEGIGIFLHDTLARTLRELGDGIWARESQTGILPLPHDLAARYLQECATALRLLAEFEEQRSRPTNAPST